MSDQQDPPPETDPTPDLADVATEEDLQRRESLYDNYEIEGGEPADDEDTDPVDVDARRDPWTPPESEGLIDPQVHELQAYLLWDTHGLNPYYDLESAFETVQRADDITFQFQGDDWRIWDESDGPDSDDVGSRQWESGLAHPNAPDDPLTEYQLAVFQDDDLHERRARLQFRARVPDAVKVETGEPAQLPDVPESVAVQVAHAENIETDKIEALIRAAVQAVGLDDEYFPEGKTHDWSRGLGLGQYVRISRPHSEEKVVPRNGILERLAMFAVDRSGQGQLMWDNREIIGHRNVVDLDATAAGKMLPDQTVAKRLKSYHTKHPTTEELDDEPTTSPKLEIQWQKTLSETTAVPWDADDAFDFADLERELDEFLLNTLSWAGLPTGPADDVYVDDAYWTVEATQRNVEVRPNPLSEIEESEEDLVVQHVDPTTATNSEWDVLKSLTKIGDGKHWSEIAEAADVSKSTIYRAADRFDPIIDISNGVVSFIDDVVRQKASAVLSTVKKAASRAVDNFSQLASGDDALDSESTLAKWARTYHAIVDDTLQGLEIELTGEYDLHQILQVLRNGYEAARRTGRNTSDAFIEARFVWHDENGERVEQRPFLADHGSVRLFGSKIANDV
jgi:hypothetical protein